MSTKTQIRKQVFERDGGICQRCKCELYLYKNGKEHKGKMKAHFHHIEFRCNGGNDSPDNLLLTCWSCEKEYHKKAKLKKGGM